MIKGADYLFVYGTLMRGFDNPFAEKMHRNSFFKGNGSFPGLLYKVDWYPGAIYKTDCLSMVYGEVFMVHNSVALLRDLDEYEDVFEDEDNSLYVRRSIPIEMENGSIVNCWTYLYNQPVTDLKLIESGNFRDVSKQV